MYQGAGTDILAVTGVGAVGLAAYLVGGWVLIVAGLALLALTPKLRKSRRWKR